MHTILPEGRPSTPKLSSLARAAQGSQPRCPHGSPTVPGVLAVTQTLTPWSSLNHDTASEKGGVESVAQASPSASQSPSPCPCRVGSVEPPAPSPVPTSPGQPLLGRDSSPLHLGPRTADQSHREGQAQASAGGQHPLPPTAWLKGTPKRGPPHGQALLRPSAGSEGPDSGGGPPRQNPQSPGLWQLSLSLRPARQGSVFVRGRPPRGGGVLPAHGPSPWKPAAKPEGRGQGPPGQR